VAALNNLAGLLREAGDLTAAADCFAAALRLAPDYAPAQMGRGQLHALKGEWGAALAAYDACLSAKPDWPPALYAKAGAHRQLGQIDEALACLKVILGAVPGDIPALEAAAGLLRQQGRLNEAAAILQRLVGLAPDRLGAWSDLADVAGALGDAATLLQCHGRILTMAPEDPERWRSFAGAVRLLRIEGFDPRLRDLLLAALSREDVDHQALAIPAVSLLKAAPAVAPLLSPVAVEGDLLDETALAALSEPLLPAVLAKLLIPDAALETAMAGLRRRLLAAALAPSSLPLAPGVLAAGQAMAQQCFLNEYLYDESDGESAALQTLQRQLSAADAPWDDLQALALAVLASYRSLHRLSSFDGVIARAKDSGHAGSLSLIARQFDEPKAEAAIAASIPCLGEISDGVSQAVRAQYEENPYPRWQSLHRLPSRPLRQLLPEICPALAGVPPPPERPRLLVAGCGTGRHALLAAQLYRPEEMVAVDLSRASLAYAIRKAQAFDIAGIDFYQADILDLPAHLAPFDVIESSGVLHHMADPLAGWRALTALLKPGGLMKLALYSEAARQHILAARELIAARGYSPTPDGIRRCRREIFARASEPAMAKLAAGRDFYSLSLCRDLIFHVQEHRFTLPQIGAACAELGLTFVGIEPQEPRQAESYRARFPEDPQLASLENWAAFEVDHPDCFAEMYHLWLRKPELGGV
jgi:SAM-dependent methyltransferase